MSTRANYDFLDLNGDVITRYYTHHDGYLEGAANYFHKALLQYHSNLNEKEPLSKSFMRANIDLCESHVTLAGDRAFSYVVDRIKHLTVFHRVYKSSGYTEKTIYKGSLYDFVNMYLEPTKEARERISYKYGQTYGFPIQEKSIDDIVNKFSYWVEEDCLESIFDKIKSLDYILMEKLYNSNTSVTECSDIIENIKEYWNKI